MKILALPRSFFERIKDPEKWRVLLKRCAIISITDSNRQPLFKSAHPNVLSLSFDDIMHPEQFRKMFGPNQAKLISDFVWYSGQAKVDGWEAILVHCNVGVGRSGAIAEVIDACYNNEPDGFYRDNPQVNPNRYVKRLMINALLDCREMENYAAVAPYNKPLEAEDMPDLALDSPYDNDEGYDRLIKELDDVITKRIGKVDSVPGQPPR